MDLSTGPSYPWLDTKKNFLWSKYLGTSTGTITLSGYPKTTVVFLVNSLLDPDPKLCGLVVSGTFILNCERVRSF
jgi:hypothetical protein